MILNETYAGYVRMIAESAGFAAEDNVRPLLSAWMKTENSELPDDLCTPVRRLIDMIQLKSGGRTDVLSVHYGLSNEQIHALQVPPVEAEFLKEIKKELRIKEIPPQKLYISDQHFYHASLNRQMDNRGFEGYEDMNRYMIDQWNKKVRARDEVYVLGDFSIAKGEATNKILSQLAGKKYLIAGNHDTYLTDKAFRSDYFRWIRPYAEIRDAGRKVVLSHYPIFCYNGQYRRDENGQPLTYMLYGHVHNTYDEVLVDRFIKETRASMRKSRYDEEEKPIPCRMINCFCMYSDYQPLSLDEWIENDRKRRENIHPEQMP